MEGTTIQQVIDSYTDSRVTEASDTARKNAAQDYETRHGLKDGVKKQGDESKDLVTKQTEGEQTPAWAKAAISKRDGVATGDGQPF